MTPHSLPVLQEYLQYNSHTGVFIWKKSTYRRGKVGEVAGSTKSEGYVVIRFKGKLYYAHLLAWYFTTGTWPKIKLDHKDGNRGNNVFTNLREASDKENARNCATHSDSTSGVKGVRKYRGKFNARICVAGKLIHLGTFPTAEEASTIYQQAALQYFGEFASIR